MAATPPPPSAKLLIRFRNRDLLGVPRMQNHCEDASVALRRRVLRHAVEAPGRLIKRLASLEHLRGLLVYGELVLAFQDVADHRTGVAVRLALLAGFQRHFYDR